jgi:hypothetical protein
VHVGDGSRADYVRHQQKLRHEPGYSIGTGDARVGDGTSPSYQRDQRELEHERGHSIGDGTAQVSGD